MPKELIHLTKRGLYCPQGDFYIDPSRGVERAFITHAHTDHARPGSKKYFCTKPTAQLIENRLAKKAQVTTLEYKKIIEMNGVKISFHPAGHVLGSAQIRLEHNNKATVITGDFKRAKDPSCESFEQLKCDTLITESTFANPSYIWPDSEQIIQSINQWWQENAKQDTTSIIFCYSLGKAQRILAGLNKNTKNQVYIHPFMEHYTQVYRKNKIPLMKTKPLKEIDKKTHKKALILAPLSAKEITDAFPMHKTALASGWVLNQESQGGNSDEGFALSDHADWPELIDTIKQTQASKVYTIHGDGSLLVEHLKNLGIKAEELKHTSGLSKWL